jgi:putative NIF3 family GTP cyclohydrolase 1 type 2
MTTARDVADVLEAIAPIESGLPDDQLGFVYGDPAKTVQGVGCVWNAHTRSIAACAAQGLDMIICHESIWMPVQDSPWYDGPTPGEIFSNRARRELLDRHNIVVYRSHSNWDALRDDGVPDQAAAALGIAGLREVGRRRFFTVNELPVPWTVAQLRAAVARGLGYEDCRIFGDPEASIRRFAFLIGGFGENQYHMPQAARDLGAEALIIGEMSEFIVISALEMGLPVIESLHSASECPAIRRQATMLAERLPDLPVRYVPSGARAF